MKTTKMVRSPHANNNLQGPLMHPTSPDLFAWVHTQRAHGCTTITMRQRADDGETLVCMWSLEGQSAEAVAASIDIRARDEGRYLRGPTLFVLYAFKDPAREHIDRKTLRIEGDTFPRSGETEPPSSSGVISMLMRHAEGATKIALGHTSNIIEQYKVMLAQAQRRIVELETELREKDTQREELVMLEHERAMSVHRAKLEEKRTDFVREKLDLIFPVLAGKVLGQGMGGPPPVINDEIMKQLMGSFTPEQMSKLGAVLTPDQQMVLGDLYLRYAQRTNDADVATAAKQAAGQPTANGMSPA